MALIKLKTNGITDGAATANKVAIRRQVFTSSGTFTVPTGITTVYVSICAGGGAGQNQGANQSGGGGAGVLWLERTVTSGTAIAVTIGAASSGTFSGGGVHGVDGNDSNFGTSGQGWYIECDGGKGSNTQKGGLYTNSSPNQVSGGGNPTQFGSGASVFSAGNARGTNTGAGRGFGTGGAGGNSGHNGMGGAAGYCVVEW
tara:strand:+ start:43 stop:642 length:600 start_codon:yes stop_codon:yes gene_type:complete